MNDFLADVRYWTEIVHRTNIKVKHGDLELNKKRLAKLEEELYFDPEYSVNHHREWLRNFILDPQKECRTCKYNSDAVQTFNESTNRDESQYSTSDLEKISMRSEDSSYGFEDWCLHENEADFEGNGYLCQDYEIVSTARQRETRYVNEARIILREIGGYPWRLPLSSETYTPSSTRQA